MHIRVQFAFVIFSGCVWSQPELPRIDTSNYLPAIRSQVEQAEQAARAHPRDAATVGAFAMTLHAYQKYEAAAPLYERAHVLEPDRFDWLYLLGIVHMELGSFERARQSFQSALALAPDAVAAELRLAQSEAAAGKLQEAAVHYRHILERQQNLARAWYGLGRVQNASGDRQSAAESYARACNLFPAYGQAHFALAQALRQLGRIQESQREMEAYAANPTTEPPLDDPAIRRVSEMNRGAQTHTQRAAELEKSGSVEDAVREQETALAADPGNVQAHINLIALYGRLGKSEKAREHFDAAVRINPGRSDIWYNYGVLLVRDKNATGAEKAFRRALEINPDYAEARDSLGVICEERGDLEAALVEFRRAVASRPDYALARFHLGRILANQRKFDEAIHEFRRALDAENDRTPVYLYALAATYARAGRREEAEAWYAKARDAASQRGQSKLLMSIERDVQRLRSER